MGKTHFVREIETKRYKYDKWAYDILISNDDENISISIKISIIYLHSLRFHSVINQIVLNEYFNKNIVFFLIRDGNVE